MISGVLDDRVLYQSYKVHFGKVVHSGQLSGYILSVTKTRAVISNVSATQYLHLTKPGNQITF